METGTLLQDVRRFLTGLRSELPEVFRSTRAPAPAPAPFPPMTEPEPSPTISRNWLQPNPALPYENSNDRTLDLPPLPHSPDGNRSLPSREQAREVIIGRVEFWSGRIGVDYGRISIRDQKTLWGSCSRRGNLNFNWRLTLAPPEVLDYVVIHELCHRMEMNHSRKFWHHVNEWCPEHRALRRWLRVNAEKLKSSHALLDIHR